MASGRPGTNHGQKAPATTKEKAMTTRLSLAQMKIMAGSADGDSGGPRLYENNATILSMYDLHSACDLVFPSRCVYPACLIRNYMYEQHSMPSTRTQRCPNNIPLI